jgi:hypothetical protein
VPKTLIPNQVFREKFIDLEWQEGLTLAEVAYRCGWVAKDSRNGKEKPDSSRVARTLGLVEEQGKFRESMSYDNAVLLCQALHIDYWEAGV